MGRDVGARRSTAIALISIGLVAVLVHGALAQRQKIPLVLPDEFLYGNYARSLANGDGLTWRGGHEGLRSLLYVFAIAPSWLVSSGPGAYAIAKGLGTLMMCCVAIPVWLLARRLLETPLALAATALALAGTWMTSTGLLLTENLALPLATASLAAMVAALQRPGSRWPWVALGLAAAATFTRLQLVVLVPILLLALLADVVRQPRGERRARLEAHRAALVVVALLTLAGLVVVAADHGALGLYREVADYRPGVGDILANTAQYGLGLIALLAAVPAAATLALACRGPNWRDDRVGPLLIVVLVATVVMLVQSGIFGAGFGLHWAIDRYVSYVAPLALVLMLLAPGRISTPVGIGIAVLLALALLAADPIGNPFEQRSTYALSHEIHGIASGLGRGAGLAILAGVVGVAGIWLLGRAAPWATLGLRRAGARRARRGERRRVGLPDLQHEPVPGHHARAPGLGGPGVRRTGRDGDVRLREPAQLRHRVLQRADRRPVPHERDRRRPRPVLPARHRRQGRAERARQLLDAAAHPAPRGPLRARALPRRASARTGPRHRAPCADRGRAARAVGDLRPVRAAHPRGGAGRGLRHAGPARRPLRGCDAGVPVVRRGRDARPAHARAGAPCTTAASATAC